MLKKGTYSVSFYIDVMDDMKVEEDEQFILTVALPPGVVSGEPSQATVTIVDNDCKQLILYNMITTFTSKYT